MSCVSCNTKIDDEPLNPNEINCGYCYWIVHEFIGGTIDWTELEDGQNHIVKTCTNNCLCNRPNFPATDLFVGAMVAVKCGPQNNNSNACCTGVCKYKIMYKNPLNPSLGKKWVFFSSSCVKNNCAFLSTCYCNEPNVYPDLLVGSIVGTPCLYSDTI